MMETGKNELQTIERFKFISIELASMLSRLKRVYLNIPLKIITYFESFIC